MTVIRCPFQMTLPEDLGGLVSAFEYAGHQLYVVGGAVRDALMGKEPKDFDVATDATPEQVLAILSDIPAWRTNEVGRSFGVVRARLHNPDLSVLCREYEIATFRTDVGNGRRPDSVIFSSIEEDVKRRDLTINALFFDTQRGEVVDYVGGVADIEQNVIRAVGEPAARFAEDRLRVLRALRFAARFGSKIDPATAAAIQADNTLAGVSAERVRDEFLKGLKSGLFPSAFCCLVDEFGFWPRVFPGLRVFRSTTPATWNVAVLLAGLLRENEPGVVAKRLNELKYSSDEAKQVSFLLRFKDLTCKNAYRLKRASAGVELTATDLMEFSQCVGSAADGQRWPLVDAFNRYALSVNGDVVAKDGFQGAALGAEIERRETELFSKLV